MAARAKQRAAYGLLALAVNVASQGAETVSLLAAARTDGSDDGRAITYGFASSDEMCIAYFAVTVPASRSNFDAQSLVRGLPGAEGCWVQSFH